MKNKLSLKISLISALIMVAASGAGIALTYMVHRDIATSYAHNSIELAAVKSAEPLDRCFLAVENLVSEVQNVFQIRFPTVEDVGNVEKDDPQFIDFKNIYAATAQKTEFVSGYWMVFNPEYSGSVPSDPEGDGFFAVKDKQTGSFSDFPVTNITKYDENDPEQVTHISWWVEVKKGKSVWMKPYYNGNTKQNLISYAIPVYSQAGEPKLLGAVGVDLDFDEIVQRLVVQKEFNDAHMFLINIDGTIAWHPDEDVYDADGHYVGTDDTLVQAMRQRDNLVIDGDFYTYRYLGVSRMAYVVTLSSSLSAGLSVASNELYGAFVRATTFPVYAYVILTVLLSVGMFFLVRYWLLPIRRLNDAVEGVRNGDLSVEIKKESNDEIGNLSENFGHMVHALRSERSAMSALAFQDGLTGVKNKNAQSEKVASLDRQIKEGVAQFAVVMCDVNDLKVLNDTYGHVTGDRAIRAACLCLCNVFAHSPVYRVGGDEFIAILEGEDYENREVLFPVLEGKSATEEAGGFRFSIGMAAFRPGIDANFADVFDQADEAMYVAKKKAKANRN